MAATLLFLFSARVTFEGLFRPYNNRTPKGWNRAGVEGGYEILKNVKNRAPSRIMNPVPGLLHEIEGFSSRLIKPEMNR